LKILLLQPSFIGDVILSTALIEQLADQYSDVKIDFFLRKGNETLLDNNPHIQNVLIWDKKSGKYSNLWRILHQIRKEKYDIVLNLQRFFSTGFLTAFSGAKTTIGFDKNPLSFLFSKRVVHQFGTKENPIHEVGRNAQLISHLVDNQVFKPKLYPSKKDFSIVPLDLKYVCIAPFSVWKTKELPTEKWITLIEKLPKEVTVFLLGGKADIARCEALKNRISQAKIEIKAGQLSFLESAALMSNAKMNYVNDSAPLHLASAMNAPVTAFFCSTIPAFGFTPLSDRSIILETKENLACRPCGLHGKKECPEGHFRCGNIPIKTPKF